MRNNDKEVSKGIMSKNYSSLEQSIRMFDAFEEGREWLIKVYKDLLLGKGFIRV